jgi:hypothetical protein
MNKVREPNISVSYVIINSNKPFLCLILSQYTLHLYSIRVYEFSYNVNEGYKLKYFILKYKDLVKQFKTF